MRKFHIETFGCQMNVHDSEKIAGLLSLAGYGRAESEEQATLHVVNTCSVREKAESKLHSYLGRLGRRKREGDDLVIGVMGCVAQQEGRDLLCQAPYVDFVLGTHQLSAVGDVMRQIEETRAPVVQTAMVAELDELAPSVAERAHPGRAYVTIMEGCNKFCTFCVVPYTRGRERCRSFESILAEIEYLAGSGAREIQLLGQNVNCWRDGNRRFIDLLRAVEVTQVEWLRFITSHPAHFGEELAEWMAQSTKLCPQLHLPLQSGSDEVLSRMRREYNCDEFRRKISDLRMRIPSIALSTDIIAGFPGETDEDFARTMEVCREIRFDSMFSFVYSPRRYTAAGRWTDDVPAEIKLLRLRSLQEMQRQIQTETNRALVQREMRVLVDGRSKKSPHVYCGRSACNRVVNFVAPAPPRPGDFARVRITNSGPNSLFGEAMGS
ncbi:MAG: tRNA (N6-isopentenyl adenosine(37)-C2)-methylthiotransferase MiaB [Acidobacteriota bacterium]